MLQPTARHTFLMKNILHRQSQSVYSVSVQQQQREGKHGAAREQTFSTNGSFNECNFSVDGIY